MSQSQPFQLTIINIYNAYLCVDRQRVEDVENEVDDGIRLVDAVMTALNTEIKARKHLLNLLSQAETFYRTQRGEVKVVSNVSKSKNKRRYFVL